MPASDDPNVLVNEVNPVSPENLHKIFVIDLNYLSSLSQPVSLYWMTGKYVIFYHQLDQLFIWNTFIIVGVLALFSKPHLTLYVE